MNKEKFIEEVKKLNIEITDEKLFQLDMYYKLLVEWNEKINLTRIIEENEVYLKHFYDSLTISKIIDLNKEETLCDLGSGAGFPGIVLKIFYPELKITLVDSLNKRINFLNLVIEKLNLKDIKAVHARIEEFSIANEEKYDVVTARAVAELNKLLELGSRLIKVNKYFVAMKANISREIENSMNAIRKLNLEIIEKQEFLLIIENSQRSLLKLKKKNSTPKMYPRKFSLIDKNPL